MMNYDYLSHKVLGWFVMQPKLIVSCPIRCIVQLLLCVPLPHWPLFISKQTRWDSFQLKPALLLPWARLLHNQTFSKSCLVALPGVQILTLKSDFCNHHSNETAFKDSSELASSNESFPVFGLLNPSFFLRMYICNTRASVYNGFISWASWKLHTGAHTSDVGKKEQNEGL